MYNWNIDTSKIDKRSEKYKIWHLNQLINFGLNEERLDFDLLKKYHVRYIIWDETVDARWQINEITWSKEVFSFENISVWKIIDF